MRLAVTADTSRGVLSGEIVITGGSRGDRDMPAEGPEVASAELVDQVGRVVPLSALTEDDEDRLLQAAALGVSDER